MAVLVSLLTVVMIGVIVGAFISLQLFAVLILLRRLAEGTETNGGRVD